MTFEPQLKSKIWAEALIRRARANGAFAYLRQHGDDDAGVVFIKVALMDGRALVWTPIRDENYRRIWTPNTPEAQSEADADAWLERALERDPDIWILEIEDRQARHFLLDDEYAPLDGT